jgi:hypothetical protein
LPSWSYLRWPGRFLAKDEDPHELILNLIAEQLQIPVAAWELYAGRDETRREHLIELLSLLGMEQFSARHYGMLSQWLEPTALQTTRGIILAQAVVEELRKGSLSFRLWVSSNASVPNRKREPNGKSSRF